MTFAGFFDEVARGRRSCEHQSGGGLGAPDDAGDSRAGMGAGADEIEVADFVVAVVGAEPGALGTGSVRG